MQLCSDNLHRFFEQVALCIMVRNGDAHLKNFGVLFRSGAAWQAGPYYSL
jgi:serine/threonine-protein kinase HipA